jgi:hypothetical protein
VLGILGAKPFIIYVPGSFLPSEDSHQTNNHNKGCNSSTVVQGLNEVARTKPRRGHQVKQRVCKGHVAGGHGEFSRQEWKDDREI